jgi:phosphoribosylanthranilate isomerase
MSPTRVKICGVTDVRDAELAARLGAWAVGMVFYEGSPRKCSVEQALRITTALRRAPVELCGVFVDATLQDLAHRTEELGLTMVQLHGDEGPSFCAEVARRTGAKVVKAVQVTGVGDVRELERYHVDLHLVDTRPRAGTPAQGLRGGTGETFDWSLLEGHRSRTPLILSGGLNAGNVGGAIARVRPFAVDCASGVERAPGHKDEGKLRAFFAAVAATREEPQGAPAVEDRRSKVAPGSASAAGAVEAPETASAPGATEAARA